MTGISHGKGECHFTAASDGNRLHTVYTLHLWNWVRTVKERTSEGQLKQAVYAYLVKIHSGTLNH